MPKKVQAFLRITPTSISHSTIDVGAGLASFLRANINLSVSDIGVGKSELIPAVISGGLDSLDLKIYRPAARGGAFRRLSLNKDLVRRLGLKPGDILQFDWVGAQIHIKGVRGASAAAGEDASLMPNRLSRWMGSGAGGVHIPFSKDAGNPLGAVAETDLIRRVRSLAQSMQQGVSSPRLVLLAGGAGNGKTHAVEDFISRLVRPEKLAGFAETFVKRAQLSRLVVLEPSGKDAEYFSGEVSRYKRIGVIQDASETDGQGNSPWALFLKELDSALNGEYDLLVVCANRGVLYTAARHAVASKAFLGDVITCLDPLNVDKDCWPMSGHDGCYLWPLDIESICSSAVGDSAALAIVRQLNSTSWSNMEALGADHPLVVARGYLASEGFRTSMVGMLRDYEMATGKNLTFRKFFSICAHLFSGGRLSSDSPALEFARTLPAYSEGLKIEEEGMLVFESYKRGLSFLLFPLFPDTTELRDRIVKVKGGDELRFLEVLADGIEVLRKRSEEFSDQPGASIFSQYSSDWGRFMDPARVRFSDLTQGARVVFGAESGIGELEQSLALNLRGLLKEIKRHCDPVDFRVLEWLAKCEDTLGRISDAKQKRAYQWFQRWITRLAGVIAKRALCLRIMSAGQRVSPASLLVEEYRNTMSDEDCRADFVTEVVSFVFGGRQRSQDRHVIDLASGACRPPAPRNGSLSISFSGQPAGSVLDGSIARPQANSIIMELGANEGRPYRVPLSLSLFDILKDSKGRGLLPGSLPAAERGAIDTIRMRQDGYVVHATQRAVIRRDGVSVNISVNGLERETRRV